MHATQGTRLILYPIRRYVLSYHTEYLDLSTQRPHFILINDYGHIYYLWLQDSDADKTKIVDDEMNIKGLHVLEDTKFKSSGIL